MPVLVKELSENNTMTETVTDGSDDEILTFKYNHKSRFKSDSEGEEKDEIIDKETHSHENSGISKRRIRIIAGDTSEEDDDIGKPVLLSDNVVNSVVNSTDSAEAESFQASDNLKQNESIQDFRQIFANKDLYDAEDSDDDIEGSKHVIGKSNFENYDAEGSGDEEKQKVGEKKPRSRKQQLPKKSNIPFSMSQRPKKKDNTSHAKEPKDEVDKIHSETQRLIRKSRVSLPYHKPRQRTLAEFLQRRPSIPTKSLRMSTDELKILAKEVNKRAREAEEFYKSSSEEEKDGNVEDINKGKEKVTTLCDTRDSEINDRKECEINKKESPSLECQNTTEVSNDNLEENSVLNKDVNKLILNTEKSCDISFSVGSNSEFTEEGLTVNLKTDPQIIEGTDSGDKNVGRRQDSPKGKGLPFLEDTQSAMDTGKLSGMNSFLTNPLHEFSELGSQDVQLQFDNTETLDQVNEENCNEELCLSKTLKNILKSKDSDNLSVVLKENTANETSIENLRNGSDIKDSPSLQVHLQNSIDSPKKTESFLKFNQFAKPDLGVCVPRSYPKLVGIDRLGSNSSIMDEEIGSQDICLKLENSETFDALNDEKSASLSEKPLQGGIKSILNFNEPSEEISKSEKENNSEVCVSESSNKLSCSSLQNSLSESLINNITDSYTESDDNKPKLPARRSLVDLFSDTISVSKDTNDISVSSSQIQGKSSKTTEDPILVLEGDETRVSFEQDDSLLLDNKIAVYGESADNECKTPLSQVGKGHKAVTPLEQILKSTLKSIKEKKETPCLKATPGEVIDLDAIPNPCNVNLLKQRFLRHSMPKASVKSKSKALVSVITAEQGENDEVEVKKEFLTLDSEKVSLVGNRSKLLDLKKELQKQIVKEREQEWSKRQLEMKEVSTHLEPDEKSECGLFDEEEEVLETESEEDEDEEVEDYSEKKHKKNKTKSAFVEDEAEVSGESEGDDYDEGDDCGDEEEEDIDDESNDELNTITVNDKSNDCAGNSASGDCSKETPDICIDNCSETEETKDCPIQSLNETTSSLKRVKTFDPFASQEFKKLEHLSPEESENIDISQTQDDELDISLGIPPYQPRGAVTQISVTGSQDFTRSPLKEMSVVDRDFCRFPHHSDALNALGILSSLNEDFADEAELLGLCSGKFSSQPPVLSQDENLYFNDQINSLSSNIISSKKRSMLQEDDSDDSMSSLMLKTKGNEGSHEASPIRGKLVVLSDDDDYENEDAAKAKKPKKLQKKIQYSDDEEEEENEVVKTLLNSDEDSLGDDLGDPQDVEYDSEENEIPVSKTAAKDFFENEAELSESEWGSADEDEKDLDDFEIEDGDQENFDQNSVKEQLDKIHMRQLLDEDQRDIKRLQEMLLEDGEFHSEGGGRQRQFRWKNLNDDDLNLGKKSDDENGEAGEEDEDESEWRRLRFEREKFLQENKDSLENEEIFSAASIKLKMKFDVVAPKKNGQVKRGSFLARSETALARIALIAKSRETPVLQPKNSRNFVFATLSQEPKEKEKCASKRKAVPQESPLTRKKTKPNTSTPSLLEKIG